MNEVHDYPPVWEEIKKAIPTARGKHGLLFAWGDVIYNPHRVKVTKALFNHEFMHSVQMRPIGPEAWWKQYLAFPSFRLLMEVPAHHVEWKTYEDQPRAIRMAMLKLIAKRLKSPIYGARSMPLEVAKALVRTGEVKLLYDKKILGV